MKIFFETWLSQDSNRIQSKNISKFVRSLVFIEGCMIFGIDSLLKHQKSWPYKLCILLGQTRAPFKTCFLTCMIRPFEYLKHILADLLAKSFSWCRRGRGVRLLGAWKWWGRGRWGIGVWFWFLELFYRFYIDPSPFFVPVPLIMYSCLGEKRKKKCFLSRKA